MFISIKIDFIGIFPHHSYEIIFIYLFIYLSICIFAYIAKPKTSKKQNGNSISLSVLRQITVTLSYESQEKPLVWNRRKPGTLSLT